MWFKLNWLDYCIFWNFFIKSYFFQSLFFYNIKTSIRKLLICYFIQLILGCKKLTNFNFSCSCIGFLKCLVLSRSEFVFKLLWMWLNWRIFILICIKFIWITFKLITIVFYLLSKAFFVYSRQLRMLSLIHFWFVVFLLSFFCIF